MNQKFTFYPCFCLLVFSLFSLPVMSQGSLDRKRTPTGGYEYTAYLPAGYDEGLNAPYPVLIYLHGGNAVREVDDIASFEKFKYGIPLLIANNFRGTHPTLAGYKWDRNDFIVVVPHLPWPCPLESGEPCTENDALWDVTTLNKTVLDVKTHYGAEIDLKRIYFTGISLGAKGVWDYAMTYSDVPAAIVPISGNAFPKNLCNLKDMPIWAFHGDADGQVAPDDINDQGRSGTYLLIDLLNKCPSKTAISHLTKFFFKGHEPGVWDNIYDESSGYNIYEWMLRHVKGNNTNIAPFIHLNQPDQRYLWNGEPMIIKLQWEAFDTDGDPLISSWHLIQGNHENVNFLDPAESPEGEKALYVRFNAAGNYVLELAVDDGITTPQKKQVSFSFVESTNEVAVTGLELYNGDNVKLRTLKNRDKIETNVLGINKVYIKAKISDVSNVQSVRFSLNDNSNFNTVKSGQSSGGNYYLSKNWQPTDGEYIITVTPFSGGHTPPKIPGVSTNYIIYINEDPVPLPVEFLNVAVKRKSGKVIVSWVTATEKSNDFFTIERSPSPSDHFDAIGTEDGAGDSEHLKHYQFIDHTPLERNAYYRVKQTDFDGKSSYSKIVQVIGTERFEVSLFPNPSNKGEAFIQLSTADLYSKIDLRVIDAMGNVSFQGNYSPEVFKRGFLLDVPNSLRAGLYFLIISQGDHKDQKKFVIK